MVFLEGLGFRCKVQSNECSRWNELNSVSISVLLRPLPGAEIGCQSGSATISATCRSLNS